jgi:hypothetical protein
MVVRAWARMTGSIGGSGPENSRPVNAAFPSEAEIAQNSVAVAIRK